MTLFVYVGGVNVSDSIRFPDPSASSPGGIAELTQAADGDPAVCQITIDDPTGSMTFLELAPVVVNETACTPQRCYTGTVMQAVQRRGPYRLGAGRVWDLSIADLNELPHRRVLRGTGAKRPAETGTARLAWLLTTTGMSGVVFDEGQIMANAWAYDEADYRGQYADDVLASIISASATSRWTFFVYWADAASHPALFYGDTSTTTFDSTLSISNVLSEVLAAPTTKFAPNEDSDLTTDGAPIYDGVYVNWEGGILYEQRTSTFTTFGVHRDGVMESTRINNATTAARHAATFLDLHSGAQDTIHCTVQLPRSKVNLIQAGHRIAVRFTHLAGYTTTTYTRVSRRTFTFTEGTNEFYDLHLELSTRGIGQTGGGGAGGDPGGFPHQPPGTAVHFYSGSLSFQSDGYGTAHVTGTGAVLPNTTNSSTNTVAPALQAGVTYNVTLTLDQTGGDNPPSVGFTDDTGAAIVGSGLYLHTDVGTGLYSVTTSFTPNFAVSNAYAYFSTGALGHPVGGRTTIGTWVVDPVGWDDGTTPTPPLSGQSFGPVTPVETPDGATSTFTLPAGYEWADGSLKVFDNRLDQTLAITSQDGATRTFTLAFSPWTNDVIEVYGQGR